MIELDNVLKRLQSVTDSSFQLFAEMRDEARRQGGGVSQVENFRLEPGIHKVMADHKMERAEAIRFILKDWMVREGMLPVD
jgi:hypothetical protein